MALDPFQLGQQWIWLQQLFNHGFCFFEGSHVTNIDRIEVSEVSKCRGINHLSYCVTFLYLQLTNLNTKGYQTMLHNFLVVLYFILITCIIAQSNPMKLCSFHASSNTGHYQSTMTSHNDPRMWCHERKVRFLLKCQTSAHNTPHARAFITLRDDRHIWTDRNSLTGIDRHWVKRKFSKYFFIYYT